METIISARCCFDMNSAIIERSQKGRVINAANESGKKLTHKYYYWLFVFAIIYLVGQHSFSRPRKKEKEKRKIINLSAT